MKLTGVNMNIVLVSYKCENLTMNVQTRKIAFLESQPFQVCIVAKENPVVLIRGNQKEGLWCEQRESKQQMQVNKIAKTNVRVNRKK